MIIVEQFPVSGEVIQKMYMVGLIQKKLLVMLSDQIDQLLPDSFQIRERHHLAVDKTTRGGVAFDFTPDIESAPNGLDPQFLKRLPDLFDLLKSTLDDSHFLTASNHLDLRAFAQKEVQSPDYNRFARPGFSLKDIQTRVKIDCEIGHYGKIIDMQTLNHIQK
jgi:hypothetical protein